MKKYVNKVVTTLKKDGAARTLDKVYKNMVVRTARFFTDNRENDEKWKHLKNKFEGQRVFLIGNGPSLNKTPLYLLKNENTMCFNRINILFERLSWRPTFYSCIDATVLDDISTEINEQILPQVQYSFFTDFHLFELTNVRKRIKQRDNVYWVYPDFTDFSFDLPRIAPSPTVALGALQILPFLGFSEIYIIGMDMDYKIHTSVDDLGKNAIQSKKDDDPNHFDPRYFGKGKKYHQPTAQVMDNTFKALEVAKKRIETTKTKVYNATYGGKIEMFERVNFESLFAHIPEDEQFKLFTASFSDVLPVETYAELTSKVQTLKDIEDTTIDLPYFMLSQDEFIKKSGKLIFDYTPHGPYKEMFVLIKR